MAIRRRLNELFVLSTIALILANVYVYFREEGDDDFSSPEISRSGLKESSNATAYDYVNPPPCRRTIEESIRLNELIANVWYKCKRTKRIPDEPLGYQICVDDAVGIQHVFGGERLTMVTLAGTSEDYRLEKTLLKLSGSTAQSSCVVFGSRPTYPITLREFSKSILYTALAPSDLADIGRLAADLSTRMVAYARNHGEGAIDILKINCLDCFHPFHSPTLLDRLISTGSFKFVRQLHLIVKIEEADRKLMYFWYKTIHRLFNSKTNDDGVYFVLYGAQQLGECGRRVQSCQYQLAFARVEAAPVGAGVKVMAPVAGMGSPDEEYNRLAWYLNRKIDGQSICANQRRSNFGSSFEPLWTLCDRFTQDGEGEGGASCLIYYFSIGDALSAVDNQWQTNFPKRCSIHLFDPTLPYDQNFNSERASLYSLTLAEESSGKTQPGLEQNRVWRLSTLQSILDQTNSEKRVISLLMLDLHGGEWDVFEQLLQAASTNIFSQLLIRIRVWQGEENENYRQYYTWLYRMEKCGFRLFNVRELPEGNSTRSENGPGYELGWVLP